MSAHLGVLTRAGLVHAERDGRTVNYRADVKAFRGLITFLTRDCCNGRPDLCGDIARLVADNDDEPRERVMTPSFNVLFLCTHNSARSIMAEALLQKVGKGRFNAYSAGSDPAQLPVKEVIERLKVLGHDVSGLRCKSWHEFTGPNAPRTCCASATGVRFAKMRKRSFLREPLSCPGRAERDTDLGLARDRQLEQISLGLNRRDSQRPANEGVSCP